MCINFRLVDLPLVERLFIFWFGINLNCSLKAWLLKKEAQNFIWHLRNWLPLFFIILFLISYWVYSRHATRLRLNVHYVLDNFPQSLYNSNQSMLTNTLKFWIIISIYLKYLYNFYCIDLDEFGHLTQTPTGGIYELMSRNYTFFSMFATTVYMIFLIPIYAYLSCAYKLYRSEGTGRTQRARLRVIKKIQ